MLIKISLSAVLVMLTTATAAGPLQDQYNAAQAAFDGGKMAEARTGFAAVLPKLDANPKSAATAAIVRARLGTAMLAAGDAEGAVPMLKRAAAALPAGGDEWQVATLDLGRASEIALDYDGAAVAYRAVLAAHTQPDSNRLSATVGLTRVLTFSDPAEARVQADAALALAKTMTSKRVNDSIAQLQTLRGRIELNDGKPAEARKWFDKALASAGGLSTPKISVADIRVRGDVALAVYQTGDKDLARKYLAFTGAGSLPSQGFELGADMPLPGCAPTGPLARDDMAVVEFTLDEDGSVSNVVPVYVTRRGTELAFARAVRSWSWQPAAAKALPLFWRQAIRMELRCVTLAPLDQSAWGLGQALHGWLAEYAPEPMPAALRGDAAAMPVLRAELVRRKAVFGNASAQLLPVLVAIGLNQGASPAERLDAAATGIAVAQAANAPLDLILYFRLQETVARAVGEATKRRQRADQTVRTPEVEALLATFDSEGNGQTRAAALGASYLATNASYGGAVARMAGFYRRIIDVPLTAMPDGDPLRQTARLQLASIEAGAARVDAARSLLAATGLSPEQCALFPIKPALTGGTDVGSNAFPTEALQWGFEGTVKVAFDIDTAGQPTGVRTVIASPPLVFDEATEKVGRGLRFQPIFRGGAAIACADQQKGVRWQVGSH